MRVVNFKSRCHRVVKQPVRMLATYIGAEYGRGRCVLAGERYADAVRRWKRQFEPLAIDLGVPGAGFGLGE